MIYIYTQHVTEIKKIEKQREKEELIKKRDQRLKELDNRSKSLQEKLLTIETKYASPENRSPISANGNSTLASSNTSPTNKENTDNNTNSTTTDEKEKETEQKSEEQKVIPEKTLEEALKSLEITNKKETNDQDVEKYVSNVKETWNSIQSYVSLPPPSDFPDVSFEDYFFMKPPGYLHLGRPQELDESKLKFKATLWISNEESTLRDPDLNTNATSIPQRPFPMKIEQLYPILDILGFGSNDHISTLRDILNATVS